MSSEARRRRAISGGMGYVDFERLARLDDAGSFFVTRAKSNLKARRRYSRPVDRSTGLVCDQTVLLTGFYSRQGFNRPLRRIKFTDPQTGKRLVFLTNNFALDALTIAKLYKCRWQVGDPDLRFDGVFGCSEERLDAQVLLDPFEEQFVQALAEKTILPADRRICNVVGVRWGGVERGDRALVRWRSRVAVLRLPAVRGRGGWLEPGRLRSACVS